MGTVMTEPGRILEMRGITKSFPGARALAGVDFEVLELRDAIAEAHLDDAGGAVAVLRHN